MKPGQSKRRIVAGLLALIWGLVASSITTPAQAAPDDLQDRIKALSGGRAFVAIDPALQVAQMGPALNVLGYDAYWKPNGRAQFKMAYFAAIRAAGFKTVRVPLFTFDYLRPDGHMDETWLKKLDTVVIEATRANLNIILDVHDFDACANDVDGCAAKLANVWYELSERYKATPSSVMFELLNEPHGAIDARIWNAWLIDLVAIVRETNPERNLIIGPVQWNSLKELPSLALPAADRHIIATFHYYEPFRFTHQGAEWAGDMASVKGVRFQATPDEIAAIGADFDKAVAWSRANNRPLLLGEFGAYDKYGALEDRVKWISTVASAADARGIARAYWYFDGGFGVYDINGDRWIGPILKALVP